MPCEAQTCSALGRVINAMKAEASEASDECAKNRCGNVYVHAQSRRQRPHQDDALGGQDLGHHLQRHVGIAGRQIAHPRAAGRRTGVNAGKALALEQTVDHLRFHAEARWAGFGEGDVAADSAA